MSDPEAVPPADEPFDGFSDPWTWDPANPDAAAPAYEVVEPVSCWRCGLYEPPAGGRCRKCRARRTDEDDRPTRRRSGRSRPPATGGGSVLALVVLYAIMLAVSVLWGWVIHFGGGFDEDAFLRGTAVVEVLGGILAVVAVAVVGRSALPPVSPGARVGAWLVGVPALLFLLVVGHLYMAALRGVVRPGLEPPAVALTTATVLLICVQPAVVEELFFRYAAFGALYRATGLHATVWVSAVMFAGAHLYNPLGMPYLFLAGVVLGYARVWGGLALPMVLHFAHNYVVTFVEVAR